MTDTENKEEVTEEVQAIPLAEFFESSPPNKIIEVSDLAKEIGIYPHGKGIIFATPEIKLHCDNDKCNGIRYFGCGNNKNNILYLSTESFTHYFLTYYCRNCQHTTKIFAVSAQLFENQKEGRIYKFGECPPFGPPTPSGVLKLIGTDKDLFLAGKRAESQGMGIGAFAYYRRVVENQKNRILNKIITVSEKLNVSKATIDIIENAKKETQFSKAVNAVKDAIPQGLLIKGHNPLLLLYSALSEGLHTQTDQECLELATSVRVVLNELAERLNQALKNEDELNMAVSRIFNKNTKHHDS